jgi:hypothetical protein
MMTDEMINAAWKAAMEQGVKVERLPAGPKPGEQEIRCGLHVRNGLAGGKKTTSTKGWG